ncbi:MAG: hypothetical protein LUD72_02945, partial [Bacteroidales bacterium]|nr:hypothetical protein [Bacteroidales bacterium]
QNTFIRSAGVSRAGNGRRKMETNNDQCCGTCRYHVFDKKMIDWYCSNSECDEYTIFTPFEDGVICDEWEER